MNEHTPHQHSPIVVIKNVSQSFKTTSGTISVLENVSLSIQKQSFNIVYGPSGSGKSTLINILTGLQRPSSGTVLYEAHNLYELTPDELAEFRIQNIGIIYQQSNWVGSLSVIENVSLPLLFAGYPKKQAERKAMESLRIVSMESFARRNPSLLSSGEQQRIAAARAIVNDPDVIIADEPTGNLDRENGAKMIKLLKYCQSSLGKTVILVSHDMEYILLADHLFHIDDGQLRHTEKLEDRLAIFDKVLSEMKRHKTELGGKEH